MLAYGGAWSQDGISRIVDLVYRSLVEHEAWAEVLGELSALVPGGKGVMLFHEAAASRGAFTLTTGFDPAASGRYDAYYNRVNPWMPAAVLRPLGIGMRAERMLPHEQLEKTEFYADWLQPQGLDTGIGLTVARRRDRVFLISVIGETPDDARWDAGAELLTAISPHLARVSDMHRWANANGLMPDATGRLFETIDTAVLAVGEGHGLLWQNGAAKFAAERGEIVRIGGSGRVSLASADASAALARMIDGPWSEDAGGRSAVFAVRSPSGQRFRLHLTNASRSKLEHYLRGACVFVTLRALPLHAADFPDELKLRFGLTPREVEVALALVDGLSVEMASDRLQIAQATVRVHVKAILAKMGVHRQSEIVSTLLKLVAGTGWADREPR